MYLLDGERDRCKSRNYSIQLFPAITRTGYNFNAWSFVALTARLCILAVRAVFPPPFLPDQKLLVKYFVVISHNFYDALTPQ